MRVREALGHTIRVRRLEKKFTLRQLSSSSSIALGYLSELERGKKEASSDVIDNIAYALEVPTYVLLIEAGKLLEHHELKVPYSWRLEMEQV